MLDYDDATLIALQEAFRDSWKTLKAERPNLDWAKEVGLRSLLSEKLMALAEDGVTQPTELSRKAIAFVQRSDRARKQP